MKQKSTRSNERAFSLSVELRELAFKRGPDAKLPTVRQICASYETSRATVNVALDKLEAQRVVYRKQGSGIYVTPTIHRKTCAILLDSSFFRQPGLSPFWGMLWGLMADFADKRAKQYNEGHQFYLVSTEGPGDHNLPQELIHAIDNGIIHGVIGVGLSADAGEFLIDRQLPVVCFAGSGLWFVEFDSGEAMHLGVASLVEDGCRRIAFWKPAPVLRQPYFNSDQVPDDLVFFKEALLKHGLDFDPNLIRNQEVGSGQEGVNRETSQEQGYRAVQETFDTAATDRPDGLLIADDMMTCGALYGLNKLGIKLGRDIKISTHTNVGSPTLYGYDNEMTLVEADPAVIVRTLFDLLETVMAGKQPEQKYLRIRPTMRRPSRDLLRPQ